MTDDLHARSIVVDCLHNGGDWPKLFEEMRAGGVTMVHVTLAIWEGPTGTLDILGRWNRMFEEFRDLIMPVYFGSDIERAKAENKIGVLLGFQNASPFEDSLDYVWVFHQLGVRVVQLTYNNQNFIGGGCYEPQDSGLSRFGHHVVREMNRLGMVVDLSHVGEQTSFDVLKVSTRPVAITHANPSFFFEHKRNKSEALLRAVSEQGGMLGCTPYPNLSGDNVTLQQWCDMIARTVDLMGIDHVGVGSDLTRHWADLDGRVRWVRMGRWTHEVDYGAGSPDKPWGYAQFPDWFHSAADFPNLTRGLVEHGFSDEEVGKIIGNNWVAFFKNGLVPA